MALTIIGNWKKSESVIYFLPFSSTQAILTRSPCQCSGEIYQLEMNKDFPSRLLVSTICSTDAVCVKPVKLVEYYN